MPEMRKNHQTSDIAQVDYVIDWVRQLCYTKIMHELQVKRVTIDVARIFSNRIINW